jgi:hypothetical protein
MDGLTYSLTSIIAVVSLLLSITVAYMTLWRRGSLCMTRPVQIIFRSANARRPEIILKTLLYATGKRGVVIEDLHLEVHHYGDKSHTFGAWSYLQGSELVSGGLRIGEDGIPSESHFFEIDKSRRFTFEEGKYELRVYAQIVNRSKRLLHKNVVMLTEDQATTMHVNNHAVIFTADPHSAEYFVSLSEQT